MFSQSSYELGEHSMFFMANNSMSEHVSFTAEFLVERGFHPWIWDPETGVKKRYPAKSSNDETGDSSSQGNFHVTYFSRKTTMESCMILFRPICNGLRSPVHGS